MKYIHLVPWSPRKTYGGYETIIRTTAVAQAEAGDEIFIVGRVMGSKRCIKTYLIDNVNYIEIEDPQRRRPGTLDIGIIGYLLLFWEILYSLILLTPIIIRLIKKEKIDAVIFYGIHLFIMAPIVRAFHTRAILGLEVIQKNAYQSKLSVLYWFRKLKYAMFSGIFTYTHYFYMPDGQVIDNLTLIKNYTKSPLAYIPWGIDVKKTLQILNHKNTYKLPIKKYEKIIICPRRLVEEKGVMYLLEAVPLVLKHYPNTLFIYAGDGIMKNKLKQKAKEMKMNSNVLFTGFLKYEDTLIAIKKSDIVVVPSSGEESFGMVFLESYLLKKPIVSTWFGGIPNVIKDKKTGVLVKPRDSKALAVAILSLLSNPKKSEEMAAQGYSLLLKEFNLSTTISKINKFTNSIKI